MYESQNGLVSYETWLAALASATCIGFTSLVPWLFNMTFFEHGKKNQGNQCEDGRMKFLLSFAVGAILGDIFFHLIPESFQSYLVELNEPKLVAYKKVGLSVVAGIFMFIIVEIILEKWSRSINKEEPGVVLDSQKNGGKLQQGSIRDAQIPIFTTKDLEQIVGSLIIGDKSRKFLENNNNVWSDLNLANGENRDTNLGLKADLANNNSIAIIDQQLKFRKRDNQETAMISEADEIDTIKANHDDKFTEINPKECQIIDTAGYLSLIANGFDNFTHGLAIGASFLVGPKVGLLTTFVIFIHEIPHEICDYAILVNSGFSRWNAVKAQSSVSLFGILGTATALYVKSVQTLNAKTVWILPFSAGGFLYIALVNLLPEILDRKTDFRNSLGQIACVILGIAFMASVAVI